MNIRKMNRKLKRAFGGRVNAKCEDGCIVLEGQLEKWLDVVRACQTCAKSHSKYHVVNNITCQEAEIKSIREPSLSDSLLEGRNPDVLIIGGGISGASIARELSKWDIDIVLVEKESDLAMQASGRNDGEIHPGIDLKKGSLKQHYIRKGNEMYTQVCRELNVPFRRVGQYVCFKQMWLLPSALVYSLIRKYIDGISDTQIVFGKKLHSLQPKLNREFKFAISNPSSGCVSPYGLTIAYGENAASNGVQICLNTIVKDMKLDNGSISAVQTNRGTIQPRLVINAAGVFAEDIARMAGDRFYSIHPRRGTNSILDKKTGKYFDSIASVKLMQRTRTHSKGGGIIHTIDDNLLVGPDAVETWEKEDYSTNTESIENVFKKQRITMPVLTEKDIITYFTGVRAATFEEDFVIENGRKTDNIIHCAGIQSPGLTTAPAVALDVEKMAIQKLSEYKEIKKKTNYNPIRKAPPVLREMNDEERDKLIKENPDYGVVICRCEEISKGEIIDALKSPICVPTVDGVKKRVRSGMGRCQGGFCMPLVMEIISEYTGKPIEEINKAGSNANISFGRTK